MVRDGNSGGSNLPNILEEQSDELFTSGSFHGGSDVHRGFHHQVQQSRDRIHQQPERIPNNPTHSSEQISPTTRERTYSIPLSSGDSPKNTLKKSRPLRPRLNQLFGNEVMHGVDQDETDISSVKPASSPRLFSSDMGSSEGRLQQVIRPFQFRSSVVQNQNNSSKPASALRRSLSVGQSSTNTSFPSVGSVSGNLSRKSQNFRTSIAKRSGGALARLTRHGSMEEERGDSFSTSQKKATVYRYSIGDPVLISNHDSHHSTCVNRHGFPPGSGSSADEQRGPYIYILATVTTVHYEENAVFYTVSRVDTGADVRGDPGM